MSQSTDAARVPVQPSTRDRLRAQKRGGETYDDVVNQMIEQYDPDEVDRAKN